jgi:ATP synthase protein I
MGGLGMEVAAQVGAGALLGWMFDRWKGTAPTGLLVGSLIGIAVGLWSLIKGALKLNRQLDRQTDRRRPAPPRDDHDPRSES